MRCRAVAGPSACHLRKCGDIGAPLSTPPVAKSHVMAGNNPPQSTACLGSPPHGRGAGAPGRARQAPPGTSPRCRSAALRSALLDRTWQVMKITRCGVLQPLEGQLQMLLQLLTLSGDKIWTGKALAVLCAKRLSKTLRKAEDDRASTNVTFNDIVQESWPASLRIRTRALAVGLWQHPSHCWTDGGTCAEASRN